jgi:hypothetical protein
MEMGKCILKNHIQNLGFSLMPPPRIFSLFLLVPKGRQEGQSVREVDSAEPHEQGGFLGQSLNRSDHSEETHERFFFNFIVS